MDEVEYGVRLLVGGLNSEDPTVRRAAVTAVGKLGQESLGKPEAVLKLLDDRDPTVRVAAVRALARRLHGSQLGRTLRIAGRPSEIVGQVRGIRRWDGNAKREYPL